MCDVKCYATLTAHYVMIYIVIRLRTLTLDSSALHIHHIVLLWQPAHVFISETVSRELVNRLISTLDTNLKFKLTLGVLNAWGGCVVCVHVLHFSGIGPFYPPPLPLFSMHFIP